jgi:hypothetical protein
MRCFFSSWSTWIGRPAHAYNRDFAGQWGAVRPHVPEWVDDLPKAGRRVWKAIEHLFWKGSEAKIRDKEVCRRAKMGRRNVQKGWVQLEKTKRLERDKDDGERIIKLTESFASKRPVLPKEQKAPPQKTEAAPSWDKMPPGLKDDVHNLVEQARSAHSEFVESGPGMLAWAPTADCPKGAPDPDDSLKTKARRLKPYLCAWIVACRPAGD